MIAFSLLSRLRAWWTGEPSTKIALRRRRAPVHYVENGAPVCYRRRTRMDPRSSGTTIMDLVTCRACRAWDIRESGATDDGEPTGTDPSESAP